MKKISSTFITLGKTIVLPSLVIIGLSISSCKKDNSLGKPVSAPVLNAKARDQKLRTSTAKVLKDFIMQFNSNQQSGGSGNGGSNWSNSSSNFTSYSTSSGTVYSWSDPTTGSTYTLSQSSNGGGGGGLGQLSYNGKSFDYGFVLSIKASAGDATWSGFFGGNTELRGLVAIDGQMTSSDFTIKNLAIFLVKTSGAGTYKFITWSPTSITNNDGIGELLDFSDVVNNTTGGFNDPNVHFMVTSDGHVTVSDQSFDMNSDAKVRDVATQVEYTLSGTIMLL